MGASISIKSRVHVPTTLRRGLCITLEREMEKEMDDTRDVEQAIEVLLDSPSGRLMTRLGGHIRRRWLWLLGAALIGFATGFTISTRLILWLTETSGLVPPSVKIVVLSPLEVILIRLRIATLIGLSACGLLLLVDLTRYVRSDSQIRDMIAETDIRIQAPPFKVMLIVVIAIGLGTLGAVYARYILIPFVLEYFMMDTLRVELTPTWRLSDLGSFVIGLIAGSMLAWQVPIVTYVALRTGAIERSELLAHRRHAWFISAVLGAMLSPPDPVSMGMVALPMVILFEIGILVDRLVPGSQGSIAPWSVSSHEPKIPTT